MVFQFYNGLFNLFQPSEDCMNYHNYFILLFHYIKHMTYVNHRTQLMIPKEEEKEEFFSVDFVELSWGKVLRELAKH
jgi:hypothetical protein